MKHVKKYENFDKKNTKLYHKISNLLDQTNELINKYYINFYLIDEIEDYYYAEDIDKALNILSEILSEIEEKSDYYELKNNKLYNNVQNLYDKIKNLSNELDKIETK